MAKYGKRSSISENLNDFTICLLGESGIGKTSTIAEACEKEFGSDGYMVLDMGKEQGMEALDGYSYETCEDWKKFDDVTKDIIKNKDVDYANLKVLVVDTLDQLVAVMTPYVIKLWNNENMSDKNFKPAKTMNGAWGGFGAADDKLVELALEKVWELKKVGVRVWFVGHVKIRNKVDALTQREYSILSTDISQRIFEGFKTKCHVIGIACIDREVETESTGRKNIVTKKEITINKIKNENAKIVFRDDNYSIDSKSRFRNIVPEIPLDADAFLTALKDAIKNSKRDDAISKKQTVKKEETPPVETTVIDDLVEDIDDIPPITTDEPVSDYPNNLEQTIRDMFKECSDLDKKAQVKEIISQYGKLNDVNDDGLRKIYDILN